MIVKDTSVSTPDWDIRLTGFFDKTMPAQINEGETLEIALNEASYSADFASVKISGISLDDLSYRDTDLSDSLLATSSTGYLSTYQFIVVVPEAELVMVRLGLTLDESAVGLAAPFTQIYEALESLPEPSD